MRPDAGGDVSDMAPVWQRYAGTLRAARERLHNLRIDDPVIPACVAGLSRIETMLRRPLRVAIFGEYNSGKTSVADLIIGNGLLPVSVIANTAVPVLVGYGEEPALFGIDPNGVYIRIDGDEDDSLTDLTYRAIDIRLPLPWLEAHHLLDTPATSTPAAYAADADIAIWCTVATRAWTESERNLWSSVPPRCRKTALLVATHKDSFYSDEDCEQVLRRLKAMSDGLFREVLLICAADPEPETSDTAATASQGLEADAAAVRAAIERSAERVRERRLAKARRIVQRVARLSLHEFGRNSIGPQAAATLSRWQDRARAALAEHTAGRLTLQRTVENLLQAFAAAAEDLRPGVIHTSNDAHRFKHRPARGSYAPPASPSASARSASLMMSDLTAVLRIVASASPYEPPDAREQRAAARATLLSLAELDGVFAEVGAWLTSSARPKDDPAVQTSP